MPGTSIAHQWRPTGRLDPTWLVDARLQLHHAVQLVVSVAISYLPHAADDSHTNLEWLPELSAMSGHELNAGHLRFALRPADLALLTTTDGSTVVDEFALSQQTVADADIWMRGVLGRCGFDLGRLTHKKHYEIPAHAVGSGKPFHLAPGGLFEELGAYYQDAWWLTTHIRDGRGKEASEPRIWPHHFDLATLITLPTPKGSPPKTIGVGVSPGDDSYAQPYIYVGPSPYPPVDRLPAISVGHWHTKNWIGAVLTGAEFLGAEGAERALAFGRESVAACEQALGAS